MAMKDFRLSIVPFLAIVTSLGLVIYFQLFSTLNLESILQEDNIGVPPQQKARPRTPHSITGISEHWQNVIDEAVDALWRKAPDGPLVVRRPEPGDEHNQAFSVRFINGSVYSEKVGLPPWYDLQIAACLQNPCDKEAHKAGGNFRDFELVVRGSDCPCDFTHCFTTVTCDIDHPKFTHINAPYVQWLNDRDGNWLDLDDRIRTNVAFGRSLNWSSRASAGVFRGGANSMTTVKNLPDNLYWMFLKPDTWDQYGRGKLLSLRQLPGAGDFMNIHLHEGVWRLVGFDTWQQAIGGRTMDEIGYMNLHEQASKFKYAIYIEGACGWADRLKWQLSVGLVPLLQETRCIEWYTMMLKPWVHYIPVDGLLDNLTASIEWARQNDEQVRRMSDAGMVFATNVLSKAGILYYTMRLLQTYIEKMEVNGSVPELQGPAYPMHYWDPVKNDLVEMDKG